MGRWQFTPGRWPTVAALFFFALTLWLGNWQSGRAETKRALQARYDAALAEAPLRLGVAPVSADSVRYRKIEVEGVFDAARTILLDNRIAQGVAGYHVLTPLLPGAGSPGVLVNRGWLPAGRSRAEVPQPPTPAGLVKLQGIAVDPHTRYVELGKVTTEGRVWQNLDFERYARQSGLRLQPILLLQTTELDDGLYRAWPRPDAGVDMHVGYAFQWYSLATTVAVLWVVMNVKRRPARGD